MVSTKPCENHGDQGGLARYFGQTIYSIIPTSTHSQNSDETAEAPRLRVSFLVTLLTQSKKQFQLALE